MQIGVEHGVGARGEKPARRFSGRQADACLLNSGNEAGLRPGGRVKENNSCRPRARKALISLDSAPEMEGNGRLWKALPRVRCAKTRFDFALMARPGAFLKDNGFDFTEARKEAGVGARRCSSFPCVASGDEARSGGPGRPGRGLHEEACVGPMSDRPDPPSSYAEGRPARPPRSPRVNGKVGMAAGNAAATH